MAHKKSSNPTTGIDPAGIYGVDYNKLVDHLERNIPITDPFTFNVNEHNFKHSSTNVAGDLWKSNGTKMDRWPKGTANQQIRVKPDGSDLEYFTPAGALPTTPTPYDYIVYKSGANYFAFDTVGSALTSNASFRTLYNGLIATLNGLGGGSIFLKRGIYDNATGGFLDIRNNILTEGEGQDVTIINNQSTDQCFKRTGTQTSNWKLMNLTVRSAGQGPMIYMSGGDRCQLLNNHFHYTSMPSTPNIMVWFDTVTSTRDCFWNIVTHNVFEGATNGQDMLGGGQMDHSIIAFNQFKGPTGATGAGQGFGIANIRYATIAHNTFSNLSNFIGLEGTGRGCIGNTIEGNVAYNCSFLKLAQQGSNNISRFNVCKGNFMIYGNSGIEIGNCYGDVIEGNVIVKTLNHGIVGTPEKCQIRNNQMIETNATGSSTTINALSKRNGGIMLRNNTANRPDPSENEISGNRIYRTAASYTYDPDGTTKTGASGGVVIDTNYLNTRLMFNILEGPLTDVYYSSGGTVVIFHNDGIRTEWSGEATVPSGATTIVVTHTLGVTPFIDQINIVPKNNMGSATKYWVSNVTSTQFTINVNTAPGGSGAIFGWSYQNF